MDWDRLERLLEQASALDELQRRDFLTRECDGDDALLAEVMSLLAHAESEWDFLSTRHGEGSSMSEPHAPIEPPASLGPYRPVELLGEGGMGEVWLARQVEPVERLVAVKIIKLGMDTRRVVARFHAERQALAAMSHPGIARLIDAGATAEGRPYYVMDVIRGDPITRFADDRELSLTERARLVIDACRAIGHAHGQGVIHRDIKPSNVLVTEEDGEPRVTVIDFGIAKAIGRGTTTSLHTRTGQVLGTPDYMSPEQLGHVAAPIDSRADVFSLGVVLYELLTGTLPWSEGVVRPSPATARSRSDPPVAPSSRLSDAETQMTIAAARSTTPRALERALRGDLDGIVLRALATHPEERYPTAEALAADLQRYLNGDRVLARPRGTLRRLRSFNRGWNRAAGLAVACAGGLVLVQGLWPTSSNEPDAATIEERGPTPNGATDYSGPITPPVALVANMVDHTVSVVDLTAQREIGTIRPGDDPQDVIFSPDGRTAYVVARGDRRIMALELATGASSWIELPGREPQGIDITPDGRALYVSSLLDDDVQVVHLLPDGHELGVRIPVGDEPFRVRMSPDGSRVYVPNRGSDDLSVIDVATDSVIATIDGLRFPYHVAVAPDGRTAYVTTNATSAIAVIDLTSHTVVDRVEVGNAPEGVQVSPDGRYVFVANQGSASVTVIDAASREVVEEIRVGLVPQHIAFTADGTLAYVPNAESNDVSVIDVATLEVIHTIEVGEGAVGIAVLTAPAQRGSSPFTPLP